MTLRRTFLVVLALAAACDESAFAPRPRASTSGASTAVPPPTSSAAATGAAALPANWRYAAPTNVVRDATGMVVTDAALATKVGADVLASGGNAVDAAVATAFALAVVYPMAGNIGGGGFAVAHVGGKDVALDFRETAPARATHDMFKGKDNKPTDKSRIGHLAAGVPGSVAGLYELYTKYGSKKKTWADLLAPAILLANDGFPVDEDFAASLAQSKDLLARFPASAALFLPNGAPPAVGSTWKSADLGKTLERIAKNGKAGFYEGETARAIAAEMRKGKGLISEGDLHAYAAKWRTPIAFDYRGHRVVSMPLPSSGGVTLAMIANQLASDDLKALGWHSAAHVHLVGEAMRRAFLARNAGLGDPDKVKSPVGELLSEAWAKQQRASIDKEHASPTKTLAPRAKEAGGSGPHTTHFSVVDGQGNAVALTTTQNAWYGSGVTVAGAGFVLNDEMDDFAAVPGAPNMFGLVMGEANAVAPGKRMLSSMTPTVVLSPEGNVELVLGAAGGPTIITAVFEELSNVVDFGFDIGKAVRAPRFHQQDFPDALAIEQGGLPEEVKAALAAMGHEVAEREHIADAPAIAHVAPSGWIGAAEARRRGALAAGN